MDVIVRASSEVNEGSTPRFCCCTGSEQHMVSVVRAVFGEPIHSWS